ncbi:ABC transporter permease [Antarcticirhabdus aurantiaca]|uniref:ABC transporter permease n=1 Tax=Antarcticirhabdus aurantiaca TaxID=2606717 RepID=A0ACD4NU45_9HYPH|nr:ABC transporter permease [Antarcticirhabdus aurantiaca]WAJ30389.1 ABC transporter permease [Jeongeuplla avenae]
MAGLIAGRLAGLLLTLFLVSVAVFAAMEVLPGDTASARLGTQATPEALASLRAELGLDRPAPERYLRWIGGVLTGDLGTSFTYGVPVAKLVADRLAVTLPLAGLALALAILVALPLGTLAAARADRAPDAAAALFAQGALALPNFWIGLLLILVFATTLRWMPSGGFPGWEAGIGAGLQALVMPAVALALPQAGVLTRVTRSAVLDMANEDFVRLARAKGLSRRRAILRHALPNALPPILTVLGFQFTFLVAGAVLVENVFNLPGLGSLARQALVQRDVVVIQDVVLIFAALTILVNFAVDLSYLLLDPRLRARR